MAEKVNYMPSGYHTVTPYLIVEGADKLIDFLKQSFDAEETERLASPDGKIMHAEVRIGDSMIMMGEAGGNWTPVPGSIYIYVRDTDATYKRALAAGAASVMEPADQFYGDRNAGVKDPIGNIWWIGTHIEDVTPEEIRKRAEAHAKASA
jgi:PhnB protein